MINVYLNYRELSFDSGESYAKIKAKMTIEKEFTLHGELVEIGHSIKTQLSENSVDYFCIHGYFQKTIPAKRLYYFWKYIWCRIYLYS